MEYALSTPLQQLPTFLSTISMVVDDRTTIVQNLIHAERKSPPRYEPSKALFCRVLQGDFNFKQSIDQAKKLHDPIERRCAVDVLSASEKFLRSVPPAPVRQFPGMDFSLPNDLKLEIAPILLRHLDPERLLVLHFLANTAVSKTVRRSRRSTQKSLAEILPTLRLLRIRFRVGLVARKRIRTSFSALRLDQTQDVRRR